MSVPSNPARKFNYPVGEHLMKAAATSTSYVQYKGKEHSIYSTSSGSLKVMGVNYDNKYDFHFITLH